MVTLTARALGTFRIQGVIRDYPEGYNRHTGPDQAWPKKEDP